MSILQFYSRRPFPTEISVFTEQGGKAKRAVAGLLKTYLRGTESSLKTIRAFRELNVLIHFMTR